jgi:hypothetical protein
MSPQTKKAEKAQKRKKMLHKKTKYRDRKATELRLRQKYPEIVIGPSNADPEFVEAIKTAVGKIDFANSNQFSSLGRTLYRAMKAEGAISVMWQIANEAIVSGMEEQSIASDMIGEFLFQLGEAIYDLVPETTRESHLPISGMRVIPAHDVFRLRFDTLHKVKTSKGNSFVSRHQPKVTIEGSERTLGFSKHSIESMCERLTPHWKTYYGSAKIHTILSDCCKFTPIQLRDGHWAVAVYDFVFTDMFEYMHHAKGALGLEEWQGISERRYKLAGYCPVGIEDEYVIAKTFLLPGFTQTPEYQAIGRSKLPPKEKERLRRIASTNVGGSEDTNLEILAWFHEQGLPQAFTSTEIFFDYSCD